MRALGINFDTGFTSAGTTTREPFDPATVRREMGIIRTDLRCDAVRITGGDRDRLETAARLAAEAGLEVWYCPFTNGLAQDELLDFLTDGAARAERLRRDGAEVVFLTGSELSICTAGFLPGETLQERVAVLSDPQELRAALATLPAAINAFLAKAVAAVRAEFGGRIGYASLPFEGVDWTPFDMVATDAGYRDAQNAAQLPAGLRALTAHGKPAAVTEFGCAPTAAPPPSRAGATRSSNGATGHVPPASPARSSATSRNRPTTCANSSTSSRTRGSTRPSSTPSPATTYPTPTPTPTTSTRRPSASSRSSPATARAPPTRTCPGSPRPPSTPWPTTDTPARNRLSTTRAPPWLRYSVPMVR